MKLKENEVIKPMLRDGSLMVVGAFYSMTTGVVDILEDDAAGKPYQYSSIGLSAAGKGDDAAGKAAGKKSKCCFWFYLKDTLHICIYILMDSRILVISNLMKFTVGWTDVKNIEL